MILSELISNAPEPGIYENVPFKAYLQWPYISNSGLSGIERSLLHWRNRVPIEETDAMRLGTLCHSGQLEPASIFRNYVVMPDLSKGITTKDGKPAKSPKATDEYAARVEQWEQQHAADKTVVSQSEFDAMVAVVSAINGNELARKWFTASGPVECAIVWDDPATGLRCKGRLDKMALQIGTIADLKTTRDCLWFGTQIADRRYYRQAAFYIDGVMVLTGEVCQFGLVAVENEKPYGVMAAPLAEDAVELGRDEYTEALRQIADAKRANSYPGYRNPEVWTLPAWKTKAGETLTLTIGGDSLTL
jgi:hypothetical protein